MPTPEAQLIRLAERAKELISGMRERTGREPDIADFLAAFKDELRRGPHNRLEDKIKPKDLKKG